MCGTARSWRSIICSFREVIHDSREDGCQNEQDSCDGDEYQQNLPHSPPECGEATARYVFERRGLPIQSAAVMCLIRHLRSSLCLRIFSQLSVCIRQTSSPGNERRQHIVRTDSMENSIQALIDARAIEAVRFLREQGFNAWLVGGAVRDALRGVAPQDYDIAWSGTPQDLFSIVDGQYLHPTGVQHGTMTWVYRRLVLEVTSFRIEAGYGDHRRPDKVLFVDRIEDDLARRDLTVNAMAWSPDEGLFDPFGGLRDLQAGRVRTVGDPHRRFSEDALRILRTMRFTALLDGRIEEETREAMHARAGDLKHVARERIWHEFLTMLCLPGAGKVIFREGAILFSAFPQVQRPDCPSEDRLMWKRGSRLLNSLDDKEALRVAWCFYLLYLGVLRGTVEQDREQGMAEAFARLTAEEPLSRKLRAAVQGLLIALQELELDVRVRTDTVPEAAHWIERFDAIGDHAGPEDLLALAEASYNLLEGKRRARILREGQKLFEGDGRTLREGVPVSRKQLAVRGADLLAWGEPQGPGIREGLDKLWRAVISGEVQNESAALKAYWDRMQAADNG